MNSPEAHNETEPGIWPPYKSTWYGGAGAALPFFRVVLYERNAADELEIRTIGDRSNVTGMIWKQLCTNGSPTRQT